MQAISEFPVYRSSRVWFGRIVSGVSALFLLVDAIMKFVQPAVVVETTVGLGYPQSVILPLGIILAVSTILYLVPRTALLGAILLTGYLGGAVATHVRVGGPAFSIIFPIIFGILIWAGLYLRDSRVSTLIPVSSEPR